MKNEKNSKLKLKTNEVISLSILGIVIIVVMVLTMVSNYKPEAPQRATVQSQSEQVSTETMSDENKTNRINTKITAEEAKKMIDTEVARDINDQKEMYLIDVRTVEEYKEGHIPFSLNIPLDKLDSIQSIVPYADKTIIVYCRSGNRSNQAAQVLEKYGYNIIYDLGGIVDWPYEVVQ